MQSLCAVLSMVQIKTRSLSKHILHQPRLSLLSWLQECKHSHDSGGSENEGGSWDGKLFHSPGWNSWAQLSREQHNIWGQWALVSSSELRLPPSPGPGLAQAPSHPFTFLAAARGHHNGSLYSPLRLWTQAQTGPGSQVSPGLGHTDTNTRVSGHGA